MDSPVGKVRAKHHVLTKTDQEAFLQILQGHRRFVQDQLDPDLIWNMAVYTEERKVFFNDIDAWIRQMEDKPQASPQTTGGGEGEQ